MTQVSLNNREMRIRLISAGITLLIAGLIFVWLFFTVISFSSEKEPKQQVNPSLLAAEEEEFFSPEDFLQPEIEEGGEPDPVADMEEEPAPSPLGEPEYSEQPNDKTLTSSTNPKPNNSNEKLVSQKTTSPVSTTNPSKKNEPDQKIQNEVGSKFTSSNGTSTGKQTGTSGSSATGKGAGGAVGSIDGTNRKLEYSPPKIDIKVASTVKVKVEVMVTPAGKVKKGSATIKNTPNISDPGWKDKLKELSEQTLWTKDAKATSDVKATITWTIVPPTTK